MGDWLPGAVEALRELSSRGKTVIFSLRLHDYEPDDETKRPETAAWADFDKMRAMLDEAGLHDVSIYPNGRGKPPAKFYIDDRAVRFENSRGDGWLKVMAEVNVRESAAALREGK
jgi:hypothetical protein